MFKKTWLFLAIVGLITASCSKEEEAKIVDKNYLCVQFEGSDMWSLVDVEDGSVVLADKFMAPVTRVVNESFFAQNDDSQFDQFTIGDIKKKLNKESYDVVTNFCLEGVALVNVAGKPWQIVDTKGGVVATLDKAITAMSGFSDCGVALVRYDDGKFGYINTKGEAISKDLYKYATVFCDGVAYVQTGGDGAAPKFAAIDATGKKLFEFSDSRYSQITLFNNGNALALEGDQVALIDKTGKKLLNVCQSDDLIDLSCYDGKAVFCDGGLYGVKDKEGNTLLRAKYVRLDFMGDGNLLGQDDTYDMGVVSPDGEVVIPFGKYNLELQYVAPQRYVVNSSMVFVLIDPSGKEICKKTFVGYVNRSTPQAEYMRVNLITAGNNGPINSEDIMNNRRIALAYLGDDYDDPAESDCAPVPVGEYNGTIYADGENYEVIFEVESCTKTAISGNLFYKKSVETYGRNGQTAMPFSGTIENGDCMTGGLKIRVTSPTDSKYYEQWEGWTAEGVISCDIKNSNGQQWTVYIPLFNWD